MKNYITRKVTRALDWWFEVEEAEIQIHRQDAKMEKDRSDYWINVLYLVLEKTGDVELPAESLEYHKKPTGAVSRWTNGDVTTLKAYKI